jgi:hypothetical protein
VIEFPRNGDLYEIRAYRPLPAVPVDLDVTANSIETDQQAENLHMPDLMLGQYRIVNPSDLRSGVEVEVDQGGREAPASVTRNFQSFFTADTPETGLDGPLTELYQFEDNDLYFSVRETDGDGANVTLTFSGFGYALDAVTGSPDVEPVPIPIQPVRSDR